MSQSMLTKDEWGQLEALLVQVADLPLHTWKEKKAELLNNLSESGKAALGEIMTWLDDAE